MTTTIPSIHTYQQGEYERLVAQLACEHETWESVQSHELLHIYDALMRRDGSRPADTWDAFTYWDDDLPEGETALYLIRCILLAPPRAYLEADEMGRYDRDDIADRFTRNLARYYDEHIRADFERERATLLEQGLPWWKRREFEATREMINDRKRGEK